MTISTQQGLFQYKKLPFGIKTAPALFQRTMETLLRDLPYVCVYIDDILVTGTDEHNHLNNLELVLQRLESAGLTLQKSKCIFTATSVEYLGNVIDKNGLHPSPSKVQAIKQAPQPTNVNELKSFLRLMKYYHKFLPNLSTSLASLHSLLRKNCCRNWSAENPEAFTKVKSLLQSPSLLVHYDDNKPLLLGCDASPYGIGAVLCHHMNDGSDKPITFIFRTFTSAEKNYSQLEKEVLAIVFAAKRLHHYLYGRHFTEHIKLWTEKDPVLSRVRKLIQSDGEIPETKAE